MPTILGSSGYIAMELAGELHRSYAQDLRLVSRNPRKINNTDPKQPFTALKGSK